MARFVLTRVWRVLVVAFGAVTVVFVIVRLSGDPVALLAPPDATAEDLVRIRHDLGLDRPIPLQYVVFIGDVLRGNWGESIKNHQPVFTLILERVPATLELGLAAFMLAAAVALPLGLLAALTRGSWVDRGAMTFALLGQSVAPFWLGLMLIRFFSVQLHWLPTSGRGSPQQLLMPAFTFSVWAIAAIARLTRTAVLDILGREYLRTARAKGLVERVVIWRHAARNAAIPVVTILGLQLGTFLTGGVIAEQVFAWPGIGLLAIESVNSRDYPVVQGVVLMFAVMFSLLNILIEVLYAWIDPRIRLGRAA